MRIHVAEFGPHDAAGIARARAIRAEVFVGEFAVTETEEYDDLDTAPGTVHVVAWDASGDLGTARVVADAEHDGWSTSPASRYAPKAVGGAWVGH